MAESIIDFNRYIGTLQNHFDTDVCIFETFKMIVDDMNELHSVDVEDTIAEGYSPLNPQLYSIKIYYPISHGELPMSSVVYRKSTPITPADVYNIKLSESNIEAYINISDTYRSSFMNGPKLRDVVNGNTLTGLTEYKDGYALVLD